MFEINFNDRKSIYEQVIDNLKKEIMTGELKPGTKLQSVREFSKVISVNPNTVQKAYRELERLGYIYTVTGVGTFVNDTGELNVDKKTLSQAKTKLDDAFKELLYLGLSHEEIVEISDEILKELEAVRKENTRD